MYTRAHNLASLTEQASNALGVRRGDLHAGDVLIMYTRNSVYQARFLGDNRFVLTGGWFDAHRGEGMESGVETTIAGSTWGGKCINRNLIACPGMRVEFGNRVITSVLQRVVKVPAVLMN